MTGAARVDDELDAVVDERPALPRRGSGGDSVAAAAAAGDFGGIGESAWLDADAAAGEARICGGERVLVPVRPRAGGDVSCTGGGRLLALAAELNSVGKVGLTMGVAIGGGVAGRAAALRPGRFALVVTKDALPARVAERVARPPEGGLSASAAAWPAFPCLRPPAAAVVPVPDGVFFFLGTTLIPPQGSRTLLPGAAGRQHAPVGSGRAASGYYRWVVRW